MTVLTKDHEELKDDMPEVLSPRVLEEFAAAGAPEGPICPRCGSSNVEIDFNRMKVVRCRSCGWSAK